MKNVKENGKYRYLSGKLKITDGAQDPEFGVKTN
jgi:hypothetical protein